MVDPRVTALAKEISQFGYVHENSSGLDMFNLTTHDHPFQDVQRAFTRHVTGQNSNWFFWSGTIETEHLINTLTLFQSLFTDAVVFQIKPIIATHYIKPWFFKDTDYILYEMLLPGWIEARARRDLTINLSTLMDDLFPEVING